MATTEAKTSIVIRDITAISEMREVEELQKQVWGINDLEVFPALALIPMREVGGVLIGAFEGERMIGFVFGFPGHEPPEARKPAESGRLILHSDMLAVRPDYRAQGLGYKLKLAQRERALASGIDTITWTFDPLQATNAHLNFGKLGVNADRYLVNYYGQTTSSLHRAGTDRLWVTWLLNSARVRERIAGGAALETPALTQIPAVVRVGGNQEPLSSDEAQLGQRPVAIEIPDNINLLLKDNVELAMRWRAATRQAFTRAMDAGYVVEEFCRLTRDGQNVGAYLLRAKK